MAAPQQSNLGCTLQWAICNNQRGAGDPILRACSSKYVNSKFRILILSYESLTDFLCPDSKPVTRGTIGVIMNMN